MASTILADNGVSSGSAGIKTTADSTGALALQTTTAGGAATTAVTIDTSQNVGIGTSSPSVKLDVSGAVKFTNGTNPYLALYNGSNTAYLQVSSGDLNFVAPSSGNITSTTGGSERMRIDSSGNLLVGTTSSLGAGITLAAGQFIWSRGTYDNTTASAANMFITGSYAIARSTSALKYKQDVRDLETIDLTKFRPVRYKSKCENDDQTKDHFGLIADEVAEAGVTELVSYGENGEVEGFQYERLTVVLLKSLQEQQALITTLTERITALEAK